MDLRNQRLGLLLWYRLSRVYHNSVRATGRHLKNWKLSTAQFDALAQIGSHPGLTQQELADKLLVTKGNITQLLTKMERLGWIRRQREWKTNYLSLTDAGRELYESVVPVQEQFQAAQFDNLSRSEKETLLHLLKKLQSGGIQNEN